MKNAIGLAVTALAFCAAGAAFASEDGGPPPMLPEEVIAIEAQSYAATYGVSEDEALRRLALMHDAFDSIEDVRASAGEDLGGIYFDNGADFALVVNTTKKGKPIPAAIRSKGRQFANEPPSERGRKLGLTKQKLDKVRSIAGRPQSGKVKQVNSARMAKTEVNQVRERNSTRNAQIPGYNGSRYDDRTGEMVIYLADEARRSEAEVRVEELYPNVPFRIEIETAVNVQTHTRGGSTLSRQSTGQRCTTGFVVRDRSTNRVGVVTAGHCEDATRNYSGMDGSSYPMSRGQWNMTASYDLAFFWTAHEAPGEFYAMSGTTPRSLEGWRSVSETSETSWYNTGSYLCHYGVASGTQSCGEVIDKTAEPVVMERTASGQLINRGCGRPGASYVACGPNFVQVEKVAKPGQVALQCVPGDSGGPWFAYGNAYGIAKSCSYTNASDPSTVKYAYYTPIIRINDLDLTLWYGGTIVDGYAR